VPALREPSGLADGSLGGASSWRVFGVAALRDQRTVGAIAPSSARLAQRLASLVPEHGEPVVVELGPGTGSVTKAISSRMAGRGHQLAIESKPELLEFLRARYPQVLAHHADAGEVADVLAEHQLEAAHAIISGLPWSLFPGDTQLRLLHRINSCLRPDGVFTTFAYLHGLALPSARRFRRTLNVHFGEVVATRTVWANLPPAITYVCREPRPVVAPRGMCLC
jgi:phosphatidylethanolamine/phosphatidyl-N-methylethanolamine N-methyltransferase